MKIDLLDPEKIRLSVDVKTVLEKLKISFEDQETELLARCKSGKHEDKDPSWKIHVGDEKNGLFYCFPCQWAGDIFDYVMQVKDIGFSAALIFVSNCCNVTVTNDNDEELTEDEEQYDEIFKAFLPREINEPEGVIKIKNGSACIEYLANRGFGREEIDYFNLKDWQWAKRVFVPITKDKKLVAWVARCYNDQDLRVLTPKGNKVGSRWGIFGFDQVDKSIKKATLVEGWGSCIRAKQANFINPIALNGSSITEEKGELLSWIDEFLYLQEGDTAGKLLGEELKQRFSDKKVNVVALDSKKDPNDYSVQELKRIVQKENKTWLRSFIVK